MIALNLEIRPCPPKVVVCKANALKGATATGLYTSLVNKGPTRDPNRITAGLPSTGPVRAGVCPIHSQINPRRKRGRGNNDFGFHQSLPSFHSPALFSNSFAHILHPSLSYSFVPFPPLPLMSRVSPQSSLHLLFCCRLPPPFFFLKIPFSSD